MYVYMCVCIYVCVYLVCNVYIQFRERNIETLWWSFIYVVKFSYTLFFQKQGD